MADVYYTGTDPSKLEAARARRVTTAERRAVRTVWFIENVVKVAKLRTDQKVRLVTELLKNLVVSNISVPVKKEVREYIDEKGRKAYRVSVTERSKPGEFPRADTTRLLKDIFSDYRWLSPVIFEGYVGTTLDYGLELETKKDRSFFVRTLLENRVLLGRIVHTRDGEILRDPGIMRGGTGP